MLHAKLLFNLLLEVVTGNAVCKIRIKMIVVGTQHNLIEIITLTITIVQLIGVKVSLHPTLNNVFDMLRLFTSKPNYGALAAITINPFK